MHESSNDLHDDTPELSKPEGPEWGRTLKKREIELKEREYRLKEEEFQLKKDDQATAGWRSPLVVAIMAAALAALGNAVVAVANGKFQRELEDRKSEQARILEMLKTGNPDKAAENLRFLLDAGLITDKEMTDKLREHLAKRIPGSGPALPGANEVLTDEEIAVRRDIVVVILDILRSGQIEQLRKALGLLGLGGLPQATVEEARSSLRGNFRQSVRNEPNLTRLREKLFDIGSAGQTPIGPGGPQSEVDKRVPAR